eukprot:6928270-Pyramimonas_sp.AAC.1
MEAGAFLVEEKRGANLEVLAASRGGEVSLNKLTPAERSKFEVSDDTEWQNMANSGAVEIIAPREAG